MSSKTMHEGELEITLELVQKLLDQQFPQYASLTLVETDLGGTMNRIFFLGDDLYVRMPRKAENRDVEKEFRCISFLEKETAVSIPGIVGVGKPVPEYPSVFGIYHWLKGEALSLPLEEAQEEKMAVDLADFIHFLYDHEVPDDFPKAGRKPIRQVFDSTVDSIEECRPYLSPEAIENLHAIWKQALELEVWDGTRHLIHADLLPTNILAQEGKLAGIIDFGSFGAGDPCFDLLPAWAVFSEAGREIFRKRMGRKEQEWRRCRAYALHQAVMIIPYYDLTYHAFTEMAIRTLGEIIKDWKKDEI